jgi:hypothetical protein
MTENRVDDALAISPAARLPHTRIGTRTRETLPATST